jgi:pimeloyl-ACP methyl ester carboxylesterase
MRASGVGAWCRQTLGNRLDLAHASEALCDWVVREMDRTPPGVAAAMHDCFESVDVSTLLPSISAPVLLLSGDNSPIASAQQKALAETPAERPGRAVCRLRPRRQFVATGALLARCSGILAI